MDRFSKAERSKLMASIKSTNTKEEVLLRTSLWKLGYRYRKNNKKVFGRPDITFKRIKIAIFVDGEFFHGFDWEWRKTKILTNREYWIPKIERNIQRDIEVNNYLTEHGWTVLRFWSNEVKKNLPEVIATIEAAIASKKDQASPYSRSEDTLPLAAEPELETE